MSTAVEPVAYPVFLNLQDRLVVIVGAGQVGQRKLAGLLQSGARVRLLDPCLTPQDGHCAAVEPHKRSYRSGDLAGAVLVFACTDQVQVNQAVADEARQRGIFCCRSDQMAGGDFGLPAVSRKGALTVAVGTGGGSPALAAEIRDRLAEQIPDSWGIGVEIIAALRRKWLTENSPEKYNHQILRSFWRERLDPVLAAEGWGGADRLLQATFGPDCSLAQLGIQLPEGMP